VNLPIFSCGESYELNCPAVNCLRSKLPYGELIQRLIVCGELPVNPSKESAFPDLEIPEITALLRRNFVEIFKYLKLFLSLFKIFYTKISV
jgi:hypothetical protein